MRVGRDENAKRFEAPLFIPQKRCSHIGKLPKEKRIYQQKIFMQNPRTIHLPTECVCGVYLSDVHCPDDRCFAICPRQSLDRIAIVGTGKKSVPCSRNVESTINLNPSLVVDVTKKMGGQ